MSQLGPKCKVYYQTNCIGRMRIVDVQGKNFRFPNDEIAFSCRHGKAYLFLNVVNVTLGEKEERMMITGMHIVADIFCVSCGSNVGWKYESAYEKSQKYKEGKFILDRFQILGPNGSGYRRIQEAQIVGSDVDEE